MTGRLPTAFTVREAVDTDLSACSNLDISYETDYAWQIDVRDDDGAIVVGFRTVRLPRAMRVTYPRDDATLKLDHQRGGEFLVAEASGTICGYLIMRYDHARSSAWITDLAIGRQWRRRHMATALLEEAYNRASVKRLERLMVETQSRNYPSICFCQKNGLTFSGFNDRYYPNQDICLFFGQHIHYDG
ncbi:MAG: GNAT family N-acetyltransferase [Anaerolineae bacterium]|nr:GNAT family N-acetyltransferase [Anaerolineae bacterium]